MQAKQYEERILKLQDALEMQKLKNMSQLGRIRTLEDQLDKVQIALEEEREEKETILKNRRTNRLLMELQEERVQRLQDLQEIYAKDKQLELLASEMSTVTQGVKGVQEEISHKDAELTGLRASVRCSAKLLQKAEKDFIETHRELEETQIKLMECKRKAMEKEKEVRLWIERYEQVMMDLHASQFQLVQVARDASSKDAALARGFAVDLDREPSDVASLRPRAFPVRKDVGASDRAVRKYRQDLIPNRSQQLTASVSNLLHSAPSTGSVPSQQPSQLQQRGVQPSRSAGSLLPGHSCTSRDCFQCTHARQSKSKRPSKMEIPFIDKDAPELQPGSKYLGYGLGLLKKNHIVAPNNNL
ncbi:hypothetical protein Gpo141_00008291 [Globisporangium polare]